MFKWHKSKRLRNFYFSYTHNIVTDCCYQLKEAYQLPKFLVGQHGYSITYPKRRLYHIYQTFYTALHSTFPQTLVFLSPSLSFWNHLFLGTNSQRFHCHQSTVGRMTIKSTHRVLGHSLLRSYSLAPHTHSLSLHSFICSLVHSLAPELMGKGFLSMNVMHRFHANATQCGPRVYVCVYEKGTISRY